MATTIDAAWLAANGPAPYYLDTADETYTLAQDVTTSGTAFAIIANGITFDLSGYTVTYDARNIPQFTNSSFEIGSGTSASGWDFTNAPTAERYAGTRVASETWDGSYSIKFSPSGSRMNPIYSKRTHFVTMQTQRSAALSGKVIRTTRNLPDWRMSIGPTG